MTRKDSDGMRRRRAGAKRENAGIAILHDDDDVIVLDKPAGLPTANAARGEDSLFVRLVEHLGEGAFVGVVSRLDRPVSGVVVFAKTRSAAASLAAQFRERTVEKEYLAIVERRFPAAVGKWLSWQDGIAWDDRQQRAVLGQQPAGAGPSTGVEHQTSRFLPAICRARVVRRLGEVSLVELRPVTGRKHQLRAQLAGHGCPIVGDRKYGGRLLLNAAANSIGLHARSVSFSHPRTGIRHTVSASVPPVWHSRFDGLFSR
jgi:23S rRNA pseudouridine1911/1915/1917 synthase